MQNYLRLTPHYWNHETLNNRTMFGEICSSLVFTQMYQQFRQQNVPCDFPVYVNKLICETNIDSNKTNNTDKALVIFITSWQILNNHYPSYGTHSFNPCALSYDKQGTNYIYSRYSHNRDNSKETEQMLQELEKMMMSLLQTYNIIPFYDSLFIKYT